MKVKNAKKKKSIKKVANGNGIGSSGKKPEWKKVVLNGNLLSDDGGLGLEGLIGLEVLEDVKGVVSITKDKPVKKKREKKISHKEEDGSDTDHKKRSKNERKKQKKLLKKSKEKKIAKQNDVTNDEPGKFVRPLSVDENAKDGKMKKGKKIKTSKQPKEDEKLATSDESIMDDLIVSIV